MMKMKNLNGSSREGGGVNYKEGVKLLDIDSTDSDQEHFSLPPLELKGARKKKSKLKTSSSGGGSSGGCGACCCRFLTVLLLVMALLSTAVIGYFTYRLQVEVRSLKAKLAQVESSSNSNPDEFHNLHSNVQDINKDIKDIKTTVDVQQTNITNILKQIGLLNSSTQNLQSSLAAAPKLQTLPDEVRQVQEQLLQLGGDLGTLKSNMKELEGLQSFKDHVEEQFTQITHKLDEMDTKQTADINGPSATNQDILTLQNNLNERITRLNFTLTGQFKLTKQGTDLQRAQMVYLQNKTNELESRMASVGDDTQIQNIVREELGKLDMSSGKADSAGLEVLRFNINSINNSLVTLESEIQNMATLESVTDLTTQLTTMSAQMIGDMQLFNQTLDGNKRKIADEQQVLDQHEVRLGKLEDAQISLREPQPQGPSSQQPVAFSPTDKSTMVSGAVGPAAVTVGPEATLTPQQQQSLAPVLPPAASSQEMDQPADRALGPSTESAREPEEGRGQEGAAKRRTTRSDDGALHDGDHQ